LALAFGLMLSCSNTDDTSTATDDTSTSTAITVSGKVQKGPYVQGTEITVRELDSSMIPTGNTFTGTIDDNTGSFSIKGTLANKIAELAADGYYFNEVSGSLSTAKLALQAFSDLTDTSSVNVNLMTHLEKKRVEYLMDSSKMTFAAAKTQAQTEIMKIFNIENVTLGNSETLDISKSGDGNAVLLAISAILQSDKTEAELTELLSTINTDIRTDGTLDSTTTKAILVTAMEYLKSRRSTIRTNIENRYSDLGISATIPAFESYAFKLDSTAPTVSSTSPSDNETFVSVNSGVSITFSEVIDNSTITINTTDTTCSGAIQLSADNFTNCIKLSSNMTISGDNVTIKSSDNLSQATTYKIKATTQVTDLALNSLTNNYIHSTGFTTFNKPSQIIFTQDGATYPNNGGSQSTGKYFAQPFRPSDNISFNYAGAAIWDPDYGGGSTAVSKVYIYTSTGSKCHQSEVMGTPDCNPNSAVVSVTPSGNNYFGDLVTINSNFTQAYFGSSSISLSDNTTYFFVVEFSSNVSMSIGICSGSLSYAGRRFSTNGSSWSNWEGGSNCTYQYRPALFYLGK
jgi:hypothetical protein